MGRMNKITSDSDSDKKIAWEGNYIRAVTRGRWEFVERKNITGIVGMIPVTDDGRLVLVAQHRPAVGGTVIELPAGLVGDIEDQRDELMETAAARELVEETGYQAGKMTRMCSGVASAGIADNIGLPVVFRVGGGFAVAGGVGLLLFLRPPVPREAKA